MKVIIHGPNLFDQSKGQFHIHRADCRDNDKEVSRNGSEYPWDMEAKSRRQVTFGVYADQIAEGADYGSCRDDLYFEPCLNDLPEEVPFGVPYAKCEIVNGTLFRVCPTCGMKIEEVADEFGELTNNYGKHFADSHRENE